MPATQAISLLDGKLSFTLPAGMADQSGKLGTQANNMHVYSDATGQKAVIVIVGDSTNEDLAVLAKRLEDQQRSRDPQLQVVTINRWRLKAIPCSSWTASSPPRGRPPGLP